jgi:hypothetical protein
MSELGLTHANTCPMMTPFRSGFPLDTIPHIDLSDTDRAPIVDKCVVGWVCLIGYVRVLDQILLLLLLYWLRSPLVQVLDIWMLSNILVIISSLLLILVWCFLPWVILLQNPLSIFLYLMRVSHLRVLSVHSVLVFVMLTGGPRMLHFLSQIFLFALFLFMKKSICDHVLFMAGAPIEWFTNKEKCHSRSSYEAEIKATDKCVKSVQQFRNLLAGLGLLDSSSSTPIFNDNCRAIDWSHTSSTIKVFTI